MNIGIMEMTAIEDFAETHLPPLEHTPEDCFRVYFRAEVFGTVPISLLSVIQGHMAVAGGYEWDPSARILRSTHCTAQYGTMVRAIVQSVAEHFNKASQN